MKDAAFAIANTIIALKYDDLQLRNELIKKGKLSEGYDEAMEKLHTRNAKVLDEIIDTIGFFYQQHISQSIGYGQVH